MEWFPPDPPFPYTKGDYSYPINPAEEYYKNKNDHLHRNWFEQMLNGDRREFFAFDCEYWIPLPSGHNKFQFYVNDFEKERSSKIIRDFNLPENHSLRMTVFPARIDYSKYPAAIIHLQLGENKNSQEGHKGFAFEFQIEENKPGEKELQCDLYENAETHK
ncbi:hypothetical protein EHQ53_04840 [Leptospira langatensis]|uniref:Uncharacterized protein n=1 Tax=Leptospira langatensis TaxID=2484983 RepID=A0ABY2MER3_9LEPT|nr:hypothetical protein EHQ53_04840 [Leptospira langatensis]